MKYNDKDSMKILGFMVCFASIAAGFCVVVNLATTYLTLDKGESVIISIIRK